MQENALSLLELNTEIKGIIKDNAEKSYWVIGEISDLKVNFSGHCYLELIQKDEQVDQVLARSRATIWAQKFRLIKPYFETTTGQKLCEGIAVMIKVSVEFHEVYGLSLNICDIEPTYTVGEMAMRKQKVIDQLVEEGVIDMNKGLDIPLPGQRIAIVSSPTAAGYEDFVDQLINNPYGYKFYLKLFPAIMQGDEAEPSMISALDRIYSYESFFDAVVIIRGGGSQIDLNCFNSYWLAYNITQFPIPVLTGIGHEQDDSVVDRVAHTRLKTPTAVATFLIERLANQENDLDEISMRIVEKINTGFISASNLFMQTTNRFQRSVKEKLDHHNNRLTSFYIQIHKNSLSKVNILQRNLEKRISRLVITSKSAPEQHFKTVTSVGKMLKQAVDHKQKRIHQNINFLQEKLEAYEPARVLERGYSITLKNGKAVKDSGQLQENDTIVTVLNKGKVESIVKKSKK